MSASKVRVYDKCGDAKCPRAAFYRVFSSRGSVIGMYCEEHANEMIAELNAEEERMRRMLREAKKE